MRTFDLSPLFRSSVGFDVLDKMFDTAYREATREPTYPPYNIVKTAPDHYQIVMAVAGFGEGEIDITAQQNTLVVKGKSEAKSEDKAVEYLHRGIAQRNFEHRFQLADHVEVSDAALEHGMLTITLVRRVPEAMQPRKISVNGGKAEVIEGKAA